jgi:hypothetical protein
VALEILIAAPIRIGSLVTLRLDRHLSLDQGRSGAARLAIPGEEVENGRPLDFPLPAATAGLIATYCRRFRPRLGDPDVLQRFAPRDEASVRNWRWLAARW